MGDGRGPRLPGRRQVAENLLDVVAGLHGSVLYLIVFLLAFGEAAVGADLVVPGEVGLVVASAAAAQGDLSLPVVIVVAVIGAVAGDSMSWFLGRRFGPPLVRRWAFTRKYLEPKLESAQAHFERRGGWSVFAARWVGALRAVVPAVAGMAGMPYPRFLAWEIPAAIGWVSVIASLGWVFGDDVASLVDRVGGWISIVVLAVLAAIWFLHRRRKATVAS